MHSSLIFIVLAAATATLTAAAPVNESKGDDTVCAPGTGFFQSCSNGFRGCCKADACTIGYCPDVAGTADETPTVTVTPVAGPNHKTHWEPRALADPTVCKPGTGFFQKCDDGFDGCCKQDACTLGYCPSIPNKRDDPTVCPPGTGFFQSCSNGFRGCCEADACSNDIGYCPTVNTKRDDPTVCAPGTGFFQSCSNGFRGCCKEDACSNKIGYCPSSSSSSVKRNHPTVCAPGTGFFQSCSNGFRGCCKKDACTVGYCPSN